MSKDFPKVNLEEDEDPLDIVENPDGTADVMEPGEDEERDPEFSENLAELLDKGYLLQMGTELMEIIERDVEDRKKRDLQYEDGIRRTGLGKDAPGGADFEGASKAVHPMLAKGSVDFASKSVKELMPANGPCKTMVIGEQTQEKIDKAERKRKYMNWQCTTQIEEYRAELERVLSQVPLGGAQYKRWWWDDQLRRPRTEAVFIDDVFMPYGCSDFYTAPRISYRQLITQQEYETRVRSGLYIDTPEADNPSSLNTGDLSKARVASDKVEGVDDSNALIYNEDGLRRMWQVEILKIEEEDDVLGGEQLAPYVIHIDDSSKMVVGYFRNWKEDDDRFRKKHWMTEWPFIPWRGGPAIGLAHLIGTLAGASTGALRAILDSAHISTFPGAVKLSGGRTAGESIQVSPTEIKEIDAPAGVDDIRKLIMPFPFPGPSAVMFQIMEWLTQQAELVVATASEKIADAGNNMPVGTALALIEQGSTNFSAVHMRLHNSMKRDLEILHRLNAENMADEETVADLGELVVGREDFQGPMDIVPVSDPNIFSETQRYAQLQAVMQLKNDPAFAQFFKQDALLARALKLLNVPDVDGIANLPKEAKRMTPLEENYAVGMQERSLKVYPEQDDLVHLKSHIQFATSPMFGANPLIASGVMAPMLQHCKEHIMALYKKHTRAATEQFKAEAKARSIPMEDADAELYGAAFTEQLLSGLLGEMIMPGLQKMQEIVQQITQAGAPKPDANIVATTQAQQAIEKMKIDSNEKIKGIEFDWKKQLEGLQSAQKEADRQSQERLAQLSTSIELILQRQEAGSNQALAEFEAQHDTQITVLKEVLAAAMTGMQETQQATAENAKKTNVMLPGGMDIATELLTPLMGQLSQTLQAGISGIGGEGSPMYAAVQGLAQQQQAFAAGLQEQRDSMGKAFAILAQALTHLNNQTGQQYEAELYVDPATGQKRARRVPVQPPAIAGPAQADPGGPPAGGPPNAAPAGPVVGP
jgi:hypothetical protein